jgi:hypothetical protein
VDLVDKPDLTLKIFKTNFFEKINKLIDLEY